MTCIVVATDLSSRSTIAIGRARMLAAETGAELVVVHVVDDDLPAAIIERRRLEAAEILDARNPGDDGADGPAVRVVVEVGEVFSAVSEVAEKAGAALIVAGDHRRSRWRDLFRDTTVERLIRAANRPVLIARTVAKSAYAEPLLAIESDEAAELLGALETVAARPARLIAVHAHGAPAAGLMFHAGISRDAIAAHQRTDSARIRSRLAKAFGSVDWRVDIRVIDEVPLEAIRSVAEQEGCDLIVVSSHARRAPLRGLLGSVSSALIREGFRDVMIVPRGA